MHVHQLAGPFLDVVDLLGVGLDCGHQALILGQH